MKSFLAGLFLLGVFLPGCKKNELTDPNGGAKPSAAATQNATLKTNKWTINTFAGSDIRGYSGDGGAGHHCIAE